MKVIGKTLMDFLLKRVVSISRTAFIQGTKLQTTSHYSSMATEKPNIEILKYQDLKERIGGNSTSLIDVREQNEIDETGVIPGSVHIPLGEVESAFRLPADQFQQKYNATKPDAASSVIFYCRSGRRSLMACETVAKEGYKKLASYGGGMMDWMEQETKS